MSSSTLPVAAILGQYIPADKQPAGVFGDGRIADYGSVEGKPARACWRVGWEGELRLGIA